MYDVELHMQNGTVYVLDNTNINEFEHKTISPQLELEENAFGSLSLTIPRKHAHYHVFDTSADSDIFNAEVIVTKAVRSGETAGDPIFRGRLLEINRDIQLNRSVMFEGELSYLNDTVQEPAEYKEVDPQTYVNKLLAVHNKKCETWKRFNLGEVTVKDDDSADHITGRIHHGSYTTNYSQTTWSCLQSLANELGGFFRIRWVEGERYLDYLKDHTTHSGQKIEFGKNLLDYAEEWSLAELYTVVIPQGASLTKQNSDGKSESYTVNIASVNNASVYYEASQEIIDRYGRREKEIKFSNISDPSHLKQLAALYLSNMQFDNMVLSLTALDLYELKIEQSRLKFQSVVTIEAELFGLIHKDMPITKISLPLKDPAHAVYSMSTNTRGIRSLSDKVSDMSDETQDAIEGVSDEIEKAGIEKETAQQAADPQDWIFGISQIMYAKDELELALLFHAGYVSRAWDVALGLGDSVKRDIRRPDDSGDQPGVYCELPELYSGKSGQNLIITHGQMENEPSVWAEIEGDQGKGFIKFITGTSGYIPLDTGDTMEEGARVIYIVARFKPNSVGIIGFSDTTDSKWLIGANENGVLSMYDETHNTWSPIQTKAMRSASTSDSYISATEDHIVILAFAHGLKDTETYPSDIFGPCNFLIGTFPWDTGDYISAVRRPVSNNLMLNTNSGINFNYSREFKTESSRYTNGSEPGTYEDHETVIKRIVECRANTYGVITYDEVVENVAWLSARFVTGVFENDSMELPDDGRIDAEEGS